MDEGSGAWIGTNQAPRMEGVGGKERGDLIKPGEFGSGFRGGPSASGSRSRADSSVAKYSVKHKDFVSYANRCLKKGPLPEAF
jgi:hypothetical protein